MTAEHPTPFHVSAYFRAVFEAILHPIYATIVSFTYHYRGAVAIEGSGTLVINFLKCVGSVNSHSFLPALLLRFP